MLTHPIIKTLTSDAKMTAWKDLFFLVLLWHSHVNLFKFSGSFHTLTKNSQHSGFYNPNAVIPLGVRFDFHHGALCYSGRQLLCGEGLSLAYYSIHAQVEDMLYSTVQTC